MKGFNDFVRKLIRIVTWVGLGFLLAMMAVVVINVITRPMGMPIKPVYELVSIFSAAAIAFAVLFTTLERSHIVIDILTSHLSKRARAGFEVITSFLSLGTLGALGYATFRFNIEQWELHERTDLLHISVIPFRYIWLFVILMVCLLLIVHFSEAISRAASKGDTK